MTNYYPLSYAQNAIWSIEKFASNTSINIIAGTLRFKEKLDFRLLEEGFNLMLKKTMVFGFVFGFKMENSFNMKLITNTIHLIFMI